MKLIRVLFSLISVVVVLFASIFSANAIGFEAETVYESVFVLYSGNSLGSGFAVGENCIVTNAHVVKNEKHISVITYGGAEYPASVLGIDEDEDIAVLIVKDVRFPYLKVADLSTMKTGDDIYAIGAPKGMAYTLTKGGVSAKERMIGKHSYIQIDAPINEGNSGGPLLNDAGEVFGMNTLKMSDSEGIGLAIPITRICKYLSSLGIELNTNGNVLESVGVPEQTEPDYPENQTTIENENGETDFHEDKRTPYITYVVAAIAGVSLIGNIVLASLLISRKKKDVNFQYDTTERMDFEIDVWE